MKNFNFKTLLPHVVAVAFFLLLTVVYFSPIVFDNKTIIQGDVKGWQGMVKATQDFYAQTGEHSHWSPSMFSGMPEFSNMPRRGGIWDALMSLFGFHHPIFHFHMGMFFAYLLGFYIFMLCIGVRNTWFAVLGALAYSLASYNIIIIEAGHVPKGYAMAWLAPLLGGIILAFRGKLVLGSIITLIFLGFLIDANHIQITYYGLLMVVCAGIAYMIYALREKNGLSTFSKTVGVLCIAAVLAVVTNTVLLLPKKDFSVDTMRGGSELTINPDGTPYIAPPNQAGLEIDYAFVWSYGIMETFTLLIPNLYGGASATPIDPDSRTGRQLRQAGANIPSLPTFWGDKPFTSGPHYAGAVVIFLFILSLFVLRGPEKWWLVATIILSIVLSWGRNFPLLNNFLFEYLPLYNRFRTPEMALIIAETAMPILAMLGLKEIIENKVSKENLLKYLKYTLGIVGGICVFFLLFGSSVLSFSSAGDMNFAHRLMSAGFPQSSIEQILDILRSHRQSMMTSDTWRSLIFVVLAFGLMWMFAQKKIRKTNYLIIALIVLVTVDMWGVARRYLGDRHFVDRREARILPTEANLQILQDPDPNFRVFNAASNTFNESVTSYFHKSIGGYSPMKLRRYQDIIDFHLSHRRGLNIDVLNMLNTKYFIAPNGQVQLNVAALGHAWFVDSIRFVANPDEDILALDDFNPSSVAIVDTSLFGEFVRDFSFERDTTAIIVLTHWQPNKIIYQTSAETPQFAVFSEVFHRNWEAKISGRKVPIVRVNYILRGLIIPEGEHEIVFQYDNRLHTFSQRIAFYSSIFVVLLLIGIGYYYWRRRENKS
ncbi:MAG: hypothetical protein FWC94_03965 [Bacteroidales bacterium]|nr:hypothetical protein [Bacteroidales bacterium]